MKFSTVVARSFSTAEAARLTGLTARQLDHWDRQGFLRPSLEKAGRLRLRRGATRSPTSCACASPRGCARSGVGLARIRRCAEALARLDPAADLGQARLLVVGSSVLWARSDREVVDLLKDGQLVLVCSLGDAVAEAAGAVARLSREAGANGPCRRRAPATEGARPLTSESGPGGRAEDGRRMRLTSTDLSHAHRPPRAAGTPARLLAAALREGPLLDRPQRTIAARSCASCSRTGQGFPSRPTRRSERWSEIEQLIPTLREKLGRAARPADRAAPPPPQPEGPPEGAAPGLRGGPRGAPRQRDHGSA